MYNFGGNTGLSPEDLKRRRSVAQAMMGGIGRSPQTVAEGLNDASGKIIGALIARGAQRDQKAGEEKATSQFDALFNQTPTFAGGNASAGYSQPAPQPQSAPSGDMAGRITSGLMQRGLPQHVAEAFVMNFDDESGLNPGINEQNPIVAGSRGGFGLAQWTGPRRRELEAFAQQQGKPVDDLDMQLDFLMTELQGSERAAAQDILGAQDAGSAAAAIVNKFLRPAEEHRARREQSYLGGSSRQPQQSGPSQEALMQALSNPFLSENQRNVAMTMLQQQQQANDPLRQAQLQGAQLNNQMAQVELDRARNPAPQFTQQTGAELGLTGPQAQMLFNVGPDGKITQIGGSGTNINVNTGAPGLGKLSSDFGYRSNPDGSPVINPETGLPEAAVIPGSKTDIEQREAEAASQRAAQTNAQGSATRADVVRRTTSRIRQALQSGGLFDLPEAGVVGERLARWGVNQEAADVATQLETLKGMVTFDRLAKLREASANGSSGLGQVTNVEIGLLASQLGALDQRSSPDLMMQTLDTIDNVFGKLSPEAAAYLMGETDQLPGPNQQQPSGQSTDFSGMSRDEVLGFDLSKSSVEEIAAWNKRMDELENGS